MKICQNHFELCKQAVDEVGLGPLVSHDGHELIRRLTTEGGNETDAFDPLWSITNHFTCEALRMGGLYLMGHPGSDENDGHYCPVCEFTKHSKDFDAKAQIGNIAGQMAAWAREKGLITKVQ